MRLARRRRLPVAISLTPLIDVVFILLIFFMLASSFLHWRAIDMAMPDRIAARAVATEQALVVHVSADGGLVLGGDTVTEKDLGETVTRRLRTEPDLRVVIRPAEGVSLQRAVDVLDLLNRAGAAGVSLVRSE